MTKYEKLEAEYNALTAPEQQWAWVLAHKDEVKIIKYLSMAEIVWGYGIRVGKIDLNNGISNLLSVLGIEAEGM